MCHDLFETFFDDNREEWRLKDAIRVDGKTYHPICYQDVRFHVNINKLNNQKIILFYLSRMHMTYHRHYQQKIQVIFLIL